MEKKIKSSILDCRKAQQNIEFNLVNKELQEHLEHCEDCRQLNQRTQEAMLILEEFPEIPENLYDRIMSRKELRNREQRKSRDVSLILQFSTVMAAAVVLGIVLGFHANKDLLYSKIQKKNEALIELKELHHLNVDRQRLF